MNKVIGWLIVVYAGWHLLVGIFSNDMGGLTSLGYNPDMPMSFGRAPLRFILGIVLHGWLVYFGSQLITGKVKLRR